MTLSSHIIESLLSPLVTLQITLRSTTSLLVDVFDRNIDAMTLRGMLGGDKALED